MKKFIFILMLMAFAYVGQSQTLCAYGATTTIATTFSVSGLAGADTSIYFKFAQTDWPGGHPYSIQIVLTDTVETHAVGVYLYASNSGVYTEIADTLSMTVSTYPLAKYFQGDNFPFNAGKIRVVKNGCTDGDLKIILTVQ
jgi:hypothetical protein